MDAAHDEVILETERLVLRRLQPDDLADLTALLTDSQVMRFWPRPMTPDEVREWLAGTPAYYAEHGFGIWATLLKPKLHFVGRCGLLRKVIEGVPELEIAYMVAATEWGQGYAPEAARAILRFAFERFAPPRVIALIRPENLPSRRVAEKLGMRKAGNCLHAELPHNIFAITREEWERSTRNKN